jgi:hypothetical protein
LLVSDDVEFNQQLRDVLNLNLYILKASRKAVLDAILIWWRGERDRTYGPVPRARIERERVRYTGAGGHLTSYSQVAVWWLDQRLRRMN